jgi:hypothetical protein
MSRPSTFAKRAMIAVAGVAALTAAAPASAQSYGSYDQSGSGYDACRREANGRGIVGALIGGALGAAVGANAGARGNRQDGALLGGGLGAIGGAVVGNNSAACRDGAGYRPYEPPRASYDSSYSQYGSGYGARPYDRSYSAPYTSGAYYGGDRPYSYGSRYEDDGYAYGRRGERYRLSSSRPAGADGCTLAESPIHMPDGRTQTRFVRVCMDDSGRYQVVD